MVKTATTTVFGNVFPLPAHPAPQANYWGIGQANVHVFTAGASTPSEWIANPNASLVLIDVGATVLMSVNGSVKAEAWPLRAGQHSFSIPPGSQISFWALLDTVEVTVLEG